MLIYAEQHCAPLYLYTKERTRVLCLFARECFGEMLRAQFYARSVVHTQHIVRCVAYPRTWRLISAARASKNARILGGCVYHKHIIQASVHTHTPTTSI